MFHSFLFLIASITPPEKTASSEINWQLLLLVVIGYGCLYLWVNHVHSNYTPSLGEAFYIMQQAALESWGEREFSRRLLDFEQMVEGKLEKTLKVLAFQPDPHNEIKWLGYCWLVRKGYGHKSVVWLWRELEKLEKPPYYCLESDLVRD
jgi:hypothetical protein